MPDEVRAHFAELRAERSKERADWDAAFAKWRAADPARAERWSAFMARQVPSDLVETLCAAAPSNAAATRAHGTAVLQKAAALLPGLVGGSADLEASNKTRIAGSPSVTPKDFSGRNLHFGVREHAMTAICNGWRSRAAGSRTALRSSRSRTMRGPRSGSPR